MKIYRTIVALNTKTQSPHECSVVLVKLMEKRIRHSSHRPETEHLHVSFKKLFNSDLSERELTSFEFFHNSRLIRRIQQNKFL